MAHIVYSLVEDDLVSTSHRSASQTLQAAKYGVGSFSCVGMRNMFKGFVSSCPRCIRHNLEGSDGFSIKLGNPRLFTLLNQESPCFHTVSMDLQGPYKVTKFIGARRTRGAEGTYKVYALFIVDLLSKCQANEFLNHCTSAEVVSALKSFSTKYRLPRTCIADAGSQLVSLEKNPVFNGLRNLGINVETVPAKHQKLNFCERSYKDFKTLMKSMRRDLSRSIYDQGESLIEVQRKINLVSSIMHCTPLMVKYSDEEERIVMKEALLRPYLGGEALDEKMAGILAGITGARDGLFADILKYGNAIRDELQTKVLSYLQEKAVSYPDQRRNKHQEDGAVALPQVHDVVAYVSDKIHLGLVTELISANVVKLRVIKNGKAEEMSSHVSLLKLIFRPNNGSSFLQLTVTALKA
jgi:hypothetical protein